MSRKLVIGGVVLAVVAAGGITTAVFAVRAHRQKVATEALSKVASELAACAVGDPMPADLATAITGVRLAEEAAADTAPPGTVAWPQRCADYTDEVQAAYERAYAAGAATKWVPVTAIKAELQNGSTQHLAEVLEALRPFVTQKASPKVPRPQRPMSGGALMSSFTPLFRRAPGATVSDVESVDGELHLTLSDASGLSSCVLDGSSFAVQCTPIASDATGVVQFAKGGRPLFWRTISGDESEIAKITDASGKLVFQPPSYSYGYTFADGRIGVITTGSEDWESYQPALVVRSAGGAMSKVASDVSLSGTPRVSGGYILWKDVDYEHPADPAKVKARSLGGGATIVAGPVDRRPSGTGHSSGHCQTPTHLFVDMSPVIATRTPDGKWTVVKQEARPDDAQRTLSCEGSTLRILDWSSSSLRVQDCDSTACASKSSTLSVPETALAASMGPDDFVVVWPKTQGLFGIRGSLTGLSTAPVVAFATADQKEQAAFAQVGGLLAKRTFADVAAVQSVAGGALLFATITGKTYAIGIKRDGTVTSIADPQQ